MVIKIKEQQATEGKVIKLRLRVGSYFIIKVDFNIVVVT